MVETCCNCDEGFGVWHVHRTFSLIRRLSDGETFAMNCHLLPQPDYETVFTYDYIKVAVDWREAVRELASASPGPLA